MALIGSNRAWLPEAHVGLLLPNEQDKKGEAVHTTRNLHLRDNKTGISLREKLAELEHAQWIDWAASIIDSEPISAERKARWEMFMVPYDMLDESVKNRDRVWADKVLEIFKLYIDW